MCIDFQFFHKLLKFLSLHSETLTTTMDMDLLLRFQSLLSACISAVSFRRYTRPGQPKRQNRCGRFVSMSPCSIQCFVWVTESFCHTFKVSRRCKTTIPHIYWQGEGCSALYQLVSESHHELMNSSIYLLCNFIICFFLQPLPAIAFLKNFDEILFEFYWFHQICQLSIPRLIYFLLVYFNSLWWFHTDPRSLFVNAAL
jgi:hypothetical protein